MGRGKRVVREIGSLSTRHTSLASYCDTITVCRSFASWMAASLSLTISMARFWSTLATRSEARRSDSNAVSTAPRGGRVCCGDRVYCGGGRVCCGGGRVC